MFVSTSLGEVAPPINILQELIEKFPKTQKCKAAILSHFDRKGYHQEWTRATYEQLAAALGYCRETISKHIKQLVNLDLLEWTESHLFPKDTANKYKVNADKLKEYIENRRCEKTRTYTPNYSHIKANKPTTYQINCKDTQRNSLGEEKAENFQEKAPEPGNKHPWEYDEPPIVIPEKPKLSNPEKHSGSSYKPKKRTSQKERSEKYVWEVGVGTPKPLFLQWRADTHYEPQGGRWKSGKYSCAFSEFYNNAEKTTTVLYSEFGRWIERTANNAENASETGMKKVTLPSTFMPCSLRNAEDRIATAVEKIKKLFDLGAEIMLPGQTAPGSQLSIPLPAIASEFSVFLPEIEDERWFQEEFLRQEIKWQLYPELRNEVEDWVSKCEGRVCISSEGLVLRDEAETNNLDNLR